MTWNPIKLRRMVTERDASIADLLKAGNELLAAGNARIDDLNAELDRLKNPPRGKNGKFCGGRG